MGVSLAVVEMATQANAATYDNIVPTGNYLLHCASSAPSGNAIICQTDSSILTVWFTSSINSGMRTTIRSSLDGSYDTTDLNVSYSSSPVTSGAGETDVMYEQSTSGMSGSTIGFEWCDDAVDLVRCDQSYVRFRYTSIDKELACHETGHAVGLTHGADAWPTTGNNDPILGCMETPDTGSHPLLGSNNADNINSTY